MMPKTIPPSLGIAARLYWALNYGGAARLSRYTSNFNSRGRLGRASGLMV